MILSLVGCYKGFNTTGGAAGVGRATTQSVVYRICIHTDQRLLSDRGNVLKITLENISKSFGKQKVLDKLDLTVESKKITVIIGRERRRQECLLKHIIGLIRPDSGRILVDDMEHIHAQ